MTDMLAPPLSQLETIERWTHDDFMLFAPEDKKAELIDGEMILASPASFQHEQLQRFLMTVLGIFVDRFDLGYLVGSRYAVYISENQTYEPDILFVRRERAQIITRRKLLEAPDLVIEILSSSTAHYDRGSKWENYAKAGVRELWLIDPYGPEGTQFFQRREDKLIEVMPVEGVIHSLTLPGFTLETAWLWPDANGQMANSYQVLKEIGAF